MKNKETTFKKLIIHIIKDFYFKNKQQRDYFFNIHPHYGEFNSITFQEIVYYLSELGVEIKNKLHLLILEFKKASKKHQLNTIILKKEKIKRHYSINQIF